jgi:hypothetical protein
MANDFDDDDEDSRKPAARPTTSPIVQMSSRQHHQIRNVEGVLDNIQASLQTDEDDVIQQRSCEIPFLITHWLTGYNKRIIHDEISYTASQTSFDERNAAIATIQKATTDLAAAFQALGAFGTTMNVCETFFLFITLDRTIAYYENLLTIVHFIVFMVVSSVTEVAQLNRSA